MYNTNTEPHDVVELIRQRRAHSGRLTRTSPVALAWAIAWRVAIGMAIGWCVR
jgi:hypothetical protein